MKRKRLYSLWLCLLISAVFFSAVDAAPHLEEPEIMAQSAVLMNLASGEVYWARAAEKRMYPASITKLLTADLVLASGNLEAKTTASAKAEATDGSTIWVEDGEVLSVRDLVYALLLESANDAAVVLAERQTGNEADFVSQMNKKAQEVGAKQTHFSNAHGLHEDDHYTTAYDYALIARAAWQQPALGGILQTLEYRMPGLRGEERVLHNNNRLLGYFEGILGGKNGYTDEAGFTFVGYASRDGLALICVILNSDDYREDAKKLLEYGFAGVPSGAVVPLAGRSYLQSQAAPGAVNRLLRLPGERTSSNFSQEAVLFEVGSTVKTVELQSQSAFSHDLPLWYTPPFWILLQMGFWILIIGVYRLFRARIEFLSQYRGKSTA